MKVYAGDLSVVRLLQKTLGNSSSTVTKVVEEQDGDKYVTCLESYFSNCKMFKLQTQVFSAFLSSNGQIWYVNVKAKKGYRPDTNLHRQTDRRMDRQTE